MEKKKTLWVISELFYPEETSTGYIMTEIANSLTSKYIVKVICGPEVYDDKKKRDKDSPQKLNPSIELFRVKAVRENKKNPLSRAYKFITISKRIFKVAQKNIISGDVVFMVSNPFPLILAMARLRKQRDFRLVMLVHDVFPEGLIKRFHLKGLLAKCAMRKFNDAYAQTDTLISLGRDMCDLLKRKTDCKTEIVQIENWADLDNIHPLNKKQHDSIVLQYAGNIGRAQGIQQIIECVKDAGNPKLKLDIWGGGSMEEELKKMVEDDGLREVVSFRGPYFRSQQELVLNDCDIAVVSLRADMYGRGVPSKTYNIMAAGKPILYIGPKNSEIGLMVEEEGIGFSFTNEDRDGVVKLLKSLTLERLSGLGQKARILAEKRFAEQTILNKFCEVV